MIELRGITWDHPRGYAPLRACDQLDDIQVTWDVRSLKDFGDASLANLAARYDLLILDHPHVGEAAQGPLIPFPEHTGVENDSLSFQSYHFEGNQWALPIDAACQVASGRNDLLDERLFPTSWTDVFRLSKDLRSDSISVGMALCPTDTLCSFLTLTAQAGDPPKADTWIQDRTVIRVIDFLCRLRDICPPECLEWNPIHLYEHMSGDQSQVAYCPLAFSYTDYSRPTTPHPHRLRFGPIPEIQGAILGGAGLGISASCLHPEAAFRYAAWICGPDCQSTLYTQHGGQPAHPRAWEVEACDAVTGGFLSGTQSALEHAFTRPRLPGWPEFQEALGECVHACLCGTQTIDKTVTLLKDLHHHHLHPNSL